MVFKEEISRYCPQTEQEAADKRIILKWIDQFPDTILLRENELAHLSASGLIVNPSRDKVLVVYHNIYNAWTWTGGHVDGERELLRVAIREAKEETGIQRVTPWSQQIATLDILPVPSHRKNGKYVNPHLHFSIGYILVAPEEQPLKVKEDENSGVKWIARVDFFTYCREPEMAEVYRKLFHFLDQNG